MNKQQSPSSNAKKEATNTKDQSAKQDDKNRSSSSSSSLKEGSKNSQSADKRQSKYAIWRWASECFIVFLGRARIGVIFSSVLAHFL